MKPKSPSEAAIHNGMRRFICEWSRSSLRLRLIRQIISTAKSRSSMVSIDVRHSSFAFVTASLGTVQAEIGDLVDRCNNKGECDSSTLPP
jgi:hypothetical protein